jgi:hypothetical protein
MSTPNQCQFWDCPQTIPRNFFLCSTHYPKYESGAINKCPGPACGKYKDAEYDVCRDCYGKTAQAWAPSRTSLGTPSQIEARVADPRQRYPAEYRTTDGHYVRSRAESMIDDWLFNRRLVHAYERKLPVEDDAICDFYLPQGEVYIEFWGKENDPSYVSRMRTKQAVYKRHNLRLISLTDAELLSLDDHLPRLLLGYGVRFT